MSSPSNSNEDQGDTTPPDVKKNENEENENKENDVTEQSPKKEEKLNDNDKKSPLVKKLNKKEETEEKDIDDSEDSGDEEVGLLDRPVEVSGSRERKKVQRLELSFTTSSKDKHEIPEGHGEKLGDCPRIEYQIQRNPVDELKVLHKILFSRPGSGTEVKKNIKKFSGFTFAKGSSEYDRKKAVLEKITSSVLKHVCEVLDIERSGTKEDIVSRILDFLLEPKPSGKQVPKSKKKASGKSAKGKHSEKKEKGGKNAANKKKKNADSSDDEVESPVDDESDIEDEEDDEEMSEEEPKKKKSKPSASKKNETQSKQKKSEKVLKVDEKKSTSKSSKRKKAAVKHQDSSSDDDAPLLKKATKSPPTDDDIKLLVKRILRGADLQEITMKKVIKQVFDEFPDFDLSDKKDYIKSTVKSVIS